MGTNRARFFPEGKGTASEGIVQTRSVRRFVRPAQQHLTRDELELSVSSGAASNEAPSPPTVTPRESIRALLLASDVVYSQKNTQRPKQDS